MTQTLTSPAPTRSCGDCAMCCRLGEIVDFKPYNQWCQHCSTHKRCDIYEARPALCRQFFCHYLKSDLGEHWYPPKSHMVVSLHEAGPRMTVLVDPETPMIWQESLYMNQLKAWAQQYPVTVMVEKRAFAIYPDQVQDLGELTEGEQLNITETETSSGIRYHIERA